jgi:hypothetical protein
MTLSEYQTLFSNFGFNHPTIQSGLEISEENGRINFTVRVNGENLDAGQLPSVIAYPNDIFGPIEAILSTYSTTDENGWTIPLFDISTHTPEIFKVFNQENTHITSFTYRWENNIIYWEFLEV